VEKQVDAFLAFMTNEPITLDLKGTKTNFISASENGYHFYTDVLFAKDEYLRTHSQLMSRFLGATRRGWQEAIDHPDEAVQVVLGKYSPDLNPQQQRRALALNSELVTAGVGREGIGSMRKEVWSEGVQILLRYKQIEKQVPVEEVFTDQYLGGSGDGH
jgi:NitT/TauT family transport system substrate-binding protein